MNRIWSNWHERLHNHVLRKSGMKRAVGVYISRDLNEHEVIITWLDRRYSSAFGKRLPLGEYCAYVDLDDEYGTASTTAAQITEEIGRYLKGEAND